MFPKKNKIKTIIYFGMIISFLFILIIDRHFAMPFIMAEFLALGKLLKFEKNIITNFLPFFLIILGQVFFLIFGIQKVKKIKLILLLSSPLLITIGLILFSETLTGYEKLSTIKTMIPFWVCSLIFYLHTIWKIKNT